MGLRFRVWVQDVGFRVGVSGLVFSKFARHDTVLAGTLCGECIGCFQGIVEFPSCVARLSRLQLQCRCIFSKMEGHGKCVLGSSTDGSSLAYAF